MAGHRVPLTKANLAEIESKVAAYRAELSRAHLDPEAMATQVAACRARITAQMRRELREVNRSLKCGARTRDGGKCQMRPEDGKDRCRLHGGLSTGPKTEEGKRRSLAALAEGRTHGH